MNKSAVVQHVDRIQEAVSAGAAARSSLVASWQRSLALHRLDPAERQVPRRITGAELNLARQAIEPLIHTAQSSLDRLYLAVGGIGCCVLLADRNGIPLERRGAPADDKTFDDWGLWPGAVWSEDCEGTNGIGTCLVERRQLTIHRDQHFLTRNTLMSCTTAPIYDHQGCLAGALDVSSCRADLTEGFANLIAMAVGDAARRIETENFRRAFSAERIALVPGEDRSALIAVDGDDLVVGATRAARLALGLTPAQMAQGLPAADLLDGPGHAVVDFLDAERGVVQRALARAGGNVSTAAQALGVSRSTLHRKLNRLGIRHTH